MPFIRQITLFIILQIINILIYTPLQAQSLVFAEQQHYQFSLGVVCEMGTHANRIGLVAQGQYATRSLQFSAEASLRFNKKNIGAPKPSREGVFSLGAMWAWGAARAEQNPLFWLKNRTNKRNALGYVFRRYMDNVGTSQHTGLVSLQLGSCVVVAENDAFSGIAADKFRTAAAAIYAHLPNDSWCGLSTTLWTGDPFTDMLDTKTQDTDYPSRYGYRDMSAAHYGHHSHGLLAAEWLKANDWQQNIHCKVGIDSEWVRHFFQNKIIHDFPLLSQKWNTAKHPHIPMVADDGSQYLFKMGQKVKPMRLFVQLGYMNDVFY